jgi:preprotein translocase subunit SecA
MRIFGSDRISGLMQRLGMEEGVPIEHGMVTRAIERAQKQVEAQNFSVRKHLLEYDDVMNKQRENIYALRRQILDGKVRLQDEDGEETELDTREYLMELAEQILDATVENYAPRQADFEQWDLDALKREVERIFAIDTSRLDFDDRTADEIRDELWAKSLESYEEKEKLVGREVLQRVERDIMLQIVDQQWKDHLYSLDHLKEGIGLRGYGQRDPLTEYKKEAFDLFQDMVERAKGSVVERLFKVQIVRDTPMELPAMTAWSRTQEGRGVAPGSERPAGAPPAVAAPRPVPRTPNGQKIGRNDPCYCGSGKKYKKCHLLQQG